VRKHFVDERIRTLFTVLHARHHHENVMGSGIVFRRSFQYRQLHVAGRRRGALPLALKRVVRGWRRHRPHRQGGEGYPVEGGRATGVTLSTAASSGAKKFSPAPSTFPRTVEMAGEDLFPSRWREGESLALGNHSLVTLHLALKNPPGLFATTSIR